MSDHGQENNKKKGNQNMGRPQNHTQQSKNNPNRTSYDEVIDANTQRKHIGRIDNNLLLFVEVR